MVDWNVPVQASTPANGIQFPGGENTLALGIQKKSHHFELWTSAEQRGGPVGYEKFWTESMFLHNRFTEPLTLAERCPEGCARPDRHNQQALNVPALEQMTDDPTNHLNWGGNKSR
jgi:hypothetical protein